MRGNAHARFGGRSGETGWPQCRYRASLRPYERFFAEITDKRIRRGVFKSVPELEAAILAYLAHRNQQPQPFTWTASIESIIEKVGRAKAALETLH